MERERKREEGGRKKEGMEKERKKEGL